MSQAVDLKDTLNLPETNFPMRANLVTREPERIAFWEKSELYKKIQDKNKDNPAFILHDGPPFTNGDVHIGTALNKILKDILLKYKAAKGFRTPYVPGWDCHGLPIEHKVARELQRKKQELSPVAMRKACEQFSSDFIEKLRGQFKRLGILADWDSEYKTMNPAYEAEIFNTFADFIEKDLIYRSKKPVYWSIPCKTALAEAEIEYQTHTSPSIWVKFSLKDTPNTSFVIWTTTPWTIPANMAIAVHPELDYIELTSGTDTYIVAEALAEDFISAVELENVNRGKTYKGRELEGKIGLHPFINRTSPVVLADYVTTDAGTGCVHTAPGHGLDDYLTGLKYGIDIYCPIDDNGCYLDDGQIPSNLVGAAILEYKNKPSANKEVIKLLQENNALLQHKNFEHQYPHCWRSKTPVIFRAMHQWFVSLDKNNYRDLAIKAIEETEWIPSWGEKRIKGAVQNRPDWCISRQRSWGVPIPIFYDDQGNHYMDHCVVRALAKKIETQGTNIWFEQTAQELLAGIDIPESWKNINLTPGTDTLDVWIDSGCSHRAVLKKNPELSWPADIYLEGSDQHRGWFQSSLWTGVISENQSPYKKVITHGFIVDEERKKISKSGEKPQTATMYTDTYGADIVRLWISSEDYVNDIPISDKILKQVVQTYRTIRNTIKFQLGNLSDFNYNRDAIDFKELTPIDQWALSKLSEFITDTTKAYDEFAFHRAYQSINRFCTVTLSAIYHDILKDRLYTYAPSSKERRSSQTALYIIFKAFLKILSPILVFTTDEAFSFLNKNEEYSDLSIHLEDWPKSNSDWFSSSLVNEIETLIQFRSNINEKLEDSRQKKELGQSLDAKITISGSEQNDIYKTLKKHETLLPEIFIVSQVTFNNVDSSEEIQVNVSSAEGYKCPRSWRWVPELVEVETYGKVSPRCKEALLEKIQKKL